MAKKQKTKASPKGRSVAAREEDAPVPVKQTGRVQSQTSLRNLAAMKLSTKTKVQKLNGTYAEQVGELVEKGLHKRAWAVAMMIYARDDEELGEMMPHLYHYIEVLKIDERAKRAPGFDLEGTGDDEGEESGEDESEARTDTVRQFPMPKGEAAE